MPKINESGKGKPEPKKPPSAPKGKEPDCKACLGTRKNSRGEDCYPCIVHGRISSNEGRNKA